MTGLSFASGTPSAMIVGNANVLMWRETKLAMHVFFLPGQALVFIRTHCRFGSTLQTEHAVGLNCFLHRKR